MIKFGTGGWRAVIADEFTKENIRLLMAGLCRLMEKEGLSGAEICVGYDRRFLSKESAHWAAEVLVGYGFHPFVINRSSPTPLMMFTVKKRQEPYGIAVTASHNPAIYNGIKVFTAGGRDADQTVTARIEAEIAKLTPDDVRSVDYDEALEKGLITEANPMNEYLDSILAAVDVDDPPEEILAYVREQRHSRLPVYADSVDNVIGILQIRKYIKACIKAGGKAVDIRPLLDEPVFVHQSTLIAEVLPELSRRKANLAIVTDNYGGTLGIVTVEDIVEELVGEIWDEDDVVEESFVPLGGGRYEVDAEMTVGEVFDRLDYTDPEDDEELCYKLLGEWTYEQFSYIPREREGFRYHRLDVRISDMRQKRIVKLIVRLLPEEPDEAAAAEAAPEKGGEPA